MNSKLFRRAISLALTVVMLVSTVVDSGFAEAIRSIAKIDDVITAQAETAHATAINEYWYNGSPDINPQANNTFHYRSGTNSKTFTSEVPPENMEIDVRTFNGVQSINVKIVPAVQSYMGTAQHITSNDINRLKTEAERYGTIGEQIDAGGGSSVNAAMEALGLTRESSWAEFTAKKYGYNSIDELQTDINKMFWERNMWRLSTNGVTSWCIEPLELIGAGMNTVDAATIMGSDQRSYLLGLIVSSAMTFGAATDNAYYVAAQALIWELVEGYLNYSDLSQKEVSGYYNGMIVGNGLQSQYNTLKSWISDKRKIPSFLTWDYDHVRFGKTNTYYYGATWNKDHFDIDDELILKDWNGLVLDWTWVDKGVYHFEPVDKYTLKVTASEYSTEPLGATNFRDQHGDNIFVGGIIYSGAGVQDQTLFAGLYDPFGGWMDIRMTAGTSLKVDKEDGFPVAGNTGAQVTIAGPGYDGTTVYDINEIEQLYVPGTYTITEVHAPLFEDPHLGYIKDSTPITITITDETENNWYMYNAQVLKNTRQKGVIQIQKKDNAKTYLNHYNEYAEYIDCTVCHDNLLSCEHTTEQWNIELSTYTQNIAQRGVKCVLCEQTFPQCGCDKAAYLAKFNELAPVDIDDVFYAGHDMRITNPLPQGDATLQGAVFEIYAEKDIILANGTVVYKVGDLVDTITTDAKGFAQSKNLDLGVYRVKEKACQEGYQPKNYKDISEVQYVIDIAYTGDENQPIQYHYREFGNSVISGHLSITKVVDYDDKNDIFDNDQASVNSNIPAKGVHYGIYLKSKENADINSFANTRLPDEFFFAPAFEDTAPVYALVEGEGEVVDGYHYGCYEYVDREGKPTGEKINPTLAYPVDNDKTNAAIKSLYMVLVTNEAGKAATYDANTVAYINIPGVGGVADNDAGRTESDMEVNANSYPLPYGEYTFVELSPPEGYDFGCIEINGVETPYDAVEYDFTIGNECKVPTGDSPLEKTEANEHHFDVINKIIYQEIYAYKVDSEYYVKDTGREDGEGKGEIFELVPSNSIIPLANIKFKLWCWNNTGNEGEYGLTYDPKDIGNEEMGYWYEYTYYDHPNEVTIDTFATDENGYFKVPTPLVYGDYVFVELNAPYSYWLPDADNTDVEDVPKNEDGSYQDWIGHIDPITGKFVWAQDQYGNTYETPIGAASFSVTNADRNVKVTVDIKNAPQKGYVVLDKTGLLFTDVDENVNGKYTETHPVFEEKGLEGAIYTITAAEDIYTDITGNGDYMFLRYKEGELVDTFTTDGRGLGVSVPLHLGKYILKETKAPYGFLLDETEYPIELTYQGEEVRIFPVEQAKYDIRQEVEFEVLKEMENADGSFIPANGKIVFGLYADQDFYNYLGEKVINKNDLLEAVTIVDGIGKSSLKLPLGKYYVKELETNKDLAMDYNKYPIEFKYKVNDTEWDKPEDYTDNTAGTGKGETVLTIKLNGGVAIQNLIKRANIELFKSSSQFPAVLQDVEKKEVFMFDYDFNEVIDKKDVDVFKDLVSGKAKLDEDMLKMSDTDGDGLLTQTDADVINSLIAIKNVDDQKFANKKVIIGPSKVTGQEKEVENSSEALMLNGVEFKLYEVKVNNELLEYATLTTNKYGYAHYDKGLAKGKYRLIETKSVNGYKFDENNPLTLDFEITTEMFNTILSFNLTNTPKDGFELTKKDVSTGKVIPNCKINILNENKEIIFKGVTDNNGIIFLTDMEPGIYYYQEIEAAAGYILDNNPYKFEIVKDGGIVKAVMTNKRIPAPESPRAPIGTIKLYMGKGVWNPATGGLVNIETVALESPMQVKNNESYSSEDLISFFTDLSVAAFISIATYLFIRKNKEHYWD